MRTGVTVIVPHDGDIWTEPVFAGAHRLNGNGELTGLEWIREAGLLGGAIGITNTHSVGVVHDALVEAAARAHDMSDAVWALPVAGETYDGALNDINGFHVRPEHVHAALAAASGGPVTEGNVGGGTGMICHEFKGGIGTASRAGRRVDRRGAGPGQLRRRASCCASTACRSGRPSPRDEVPSPWDQVDALQRPGGAGGGLDHRDRGDRCARCSPTSARGWRSGSGWASRGWAATRSHGSGDLFVAFATGNRGPRRGAARTIPRPTVDLRMVVDEHINPLLEAVAEATEEAIVNALVAAETMIGRDGITAHAIDHDRLSDGHARARAPAGLGGCPVRTSLDVVADGRFGRRAGARRGRQ